MTQQDLFWTAVTELRNRRTPIKPELLALAVKQPDMSIAVSRATGKRWIEAEPYILEKTTPRSIYSVLNYCKECIRGRWTLLENILLENPEYQDSIVDYAQFVLKNRWKEGEETLVDPEYVSQYARMVLKNRWKEKENIILRSEEAILEYAFYVVKGRWKEGEEALLRLAEENDQKQETAQYICRYAQIVIRDRWREAEPYIKLSSSNALLYAKTVIAGRWKEGESIIAKCPESSCEYATQVLFCAFPEAEETILNSEKYYEYFSFAYEEYANLAKKLSTRFEPNMTVLDVVNQITSRNINFENKLLNSTYNHKKLFWYAHNVLKGRWLEAENKISKSSKTSLEYAKYVVKGRWEKGEKSISKNESLLTEYAVDVVKGKLTSTLHNKMLAFAIKGSDKIKPYFEMLSEINEAGSEE